MGIKGDWPRPYSTTQAERDLRHRYATTEMTLAQFNRALKELTKQGLIQRDGRVVK